MKERIKLEVPTSWSDITLKSYLALQKDLENYKDNEEAHLDFMIHHLCGVNLDMLEGLTKESHDKIKEKLYGFEKPDSLPLQKFVTIDGIEYGFEPNLSKMSYGAYVDISEYNNLAIDSNWGKIMNILYRPVTKKNGDLYTIEPYDGKDDWEKWLEVKMDVHLGSLFFFINLWRDLLHATLNSLKETELPPNIKSILGKSGKVITQSMSLQEEIYKKWMK